MRIGIFGGGFDPPHIGHFICGQAAAETANLQMVLVVPSAIPPHKTTHTYAPPKLRLQMTEAATRDDPLFQCADIEIERGGVSYTVDTLETLSEQYTKRDCELYLIMGSDAYADIESWRKPNRIFELAEVVVMMRGHQPPTQPVRPEWAGRAKFFNTPLIDISSTWIRARVKSNLPYRHLVNPGVADIIERHGLYRN